MNKLFKAVCFGLLYMAVVTTANAQEPFPSKPITIVVPFGPGSGSDVVARLLGKRLGDVFGRPVIIENKPGANGTIAAEYVARAKPDGYTLLIGTNSTHGANPGLIKDMHYDPVKDFAPVNRLVIYTSLVVVNQNAPFRTMEDLIEYGKNKELTLATGNASGIVQGETLARQVGWKLLRVPFKSNPPALTEVITGRIDFMFSDVASASALIKAGKLRPLAVTSKTRSALMPNLPTVAELGVVDYDLSGWIALFAPTGTPPAVVEKLNAEATRFLELPDTRSRFLELGGELRPMTVPDFTKWVKQEVARWTRLVKEAGIQPE
ncbi:Bug family tripartite tricarboxylate transporter substrate binding protein [Noviherbaspirillum sedimenti]|uniref:Tripartite tricarboxylate transporter substrate binding protein n=1 Tax=Noviherbaspirillum sedimenti TaxID=2320865 RepID=A0A3A3G9M3_9BURK|nr:tripartite tricarboxylate transporter substrate binding protein [Noviherbaspirillum sedimenti]RJG03282.1 tripartite tricarboxylate transporter substrate binding protein [Noviherbaspirillum sedimenti]